MPQDVMLHERAFHPGKPEYVQKTGVVYCIPGSKTTNYFIEPEKFKGCSDDARAGTYHR